MSVNLSIKAVPDELAETLRQRALRNHRSLQGELMAILEAAVQSAAPLQGAEVATEHAAPAWRRSLMAVQPLMRPMRGTRQIEDLLAASRKRRTRPSTEFGNSVDMIRQLRDER